MSGAHAVELQVLQLVTLLISISAFAIAIYALRRRDRAKALDLRLSLGKSLTGLRSSAKLLAQRRGAVSGNGAKDRAAWSSESDWEADWSGLQKSIAQLPASHQALLRLGMAELEARILEVHGLSVELSRLNEKYRNTEADD